MQTAPCFVLLLAAVLPGALSLQVYLTNCPPDSIRRGFYCIKLCPSGYLRHGAICIPTENHLSSTTEVHTNEKIVRRRSIGTTSCPQGLKRHGSICKPTENYLSSTPEVHTNEKRVRRSFLPKLTCPFGSIRRMNLCVPLHIKGAEERSTTEVPSLDSEVETCPDGYMEIPLLGSNEKICWPVLDDEKEENEEILSDYNNYDTLSDSDLKQGVKDVGFSDENETEGKKSNQVLKKEKKDKSQNREDIQIEQDVAE